MNIGNIGTGTSYLVSPIIVPSTFNVSTDPFGRLRVSAPYTLFNSQQRFGLDPSFFSTLVGTTGQSVTYNSTTCTSNLYVNVISPSYYGSVINETKYIMPCAPGNSILVLCSFIMNPKIVSGGSALLTQRVGYYGNSNGVYFELSDKMYIVLRLNGNNTAIASTAWNIDHLDGFGTSGVTLDITKPQIFWCDIENMGIGNIRCGFNINGQYLLAHIFQNVNTNTTYLPTFSLPVRFEIFGARGGTGSLTQMQSVVMSESLGYTQHLVTYSQSGAIAPTTISSTWIPVLGLQLASSRLDSYVQIKEVLFYSSAYTTYPLYWALYYNVATTGTYSAHATSNNVVICTSVTVSSYSGAYQLASGIIQPGSNSPMGTGSLSPLAISTINTVFSRIGRTSTSDTMLLAISSPNGSITSPTILTYNISWGELL